MNIYISGISGTGMGPLALMAKDAGFQVFGSDLQAGAISSELSAHNISFQIGAQDGTFLRSCHQQTPIDWFIHTSALPKDHPELLLAQQLGIKTSKRDVFLNFLIERLNLKLIAVSGTHGKTTTTAMLIWLFTQLNIPISYIVGTTLPFASSGAYNPNSKYFIYEADEYDRNFLSFRPYIAVIPSVSYDHPDIYPTEADYLAAFADFEDQSQIVVKNPQENSAITLAGEVRRKDADLAIQAFRHLDLSVSQSDLIATINNFPGVGRRFEQIADGFYSDYAHHPEEIIATIQMAQEEAARTNKRGVIAIYEPHQNARQVEIFSEYKNAFAGVSHLYWLPTFLTREDPKLNILTPDDFIHSLINSDLAEAVLLDDTLAEKIKDWHAQNYLIILMTAGPADSWFRKQFVIKN